MRQPRTQADHFKAVRDRMLAQGAAASDGEATAAPTATVVALAAERAASILAAGTPHRDLQAIVNKDAVIRLSLAGVPVARIAAELGLSYGHVSVLRRQLGVARRR